ncbi:MAG: carbon-nitrogen hydrolase family protein [Planctomycetes bacterium]|nr:carbon-nitrogen hydrolase family protein [Planctomycetota bacterium]
MRQGLFSLLVAVLLASAAGAQTTIEERMERVRAERSVAAGVDLIKWDSLQREGGWQRWWPRDQQAPGFSLDATKGARGAPALLLGGAGRKHVFGGWRYTVTKVEEARDYRFIAKLDVRSVPNPRRNMLCRVRWTGKDLGNEVTPDYVTRYVRGQGYEMSFDETFVAPRGAEGAVVELLIQEIPSAVVIFREVRFEAGATARARIVRVACVYWDASGGESVEGTLKALGALVDKAAAKQADVVVLPETITSVGTGLSPQKAAEKLPGKVFFALSEKAREHKCYIIYGFYEADQGAIYSSAAVIARDGTLAGTYRKVQVSPREAEAGVTGGAFFKTFKLDFGKVGILVSRDAAFPESARVEMLDQAEIIFVVMRREDLKTLQARAVDNGVWLAASGIDTPSVVIDPTGSVAAMAFKGIGDSVALHQIDLAKKVRRPWVGDWRNQVLKERRTDAYLKIVQE